METVHLRRFYNNFASVRSSVTPPLPLLGMDTEAVLVETYEAGESSRDIRPGAQKGCLLKGKPLCLIVSCVSSHGMIARC